MRVESLVEKIESVADFVATSGHDAQIYAVDNLIKEIEGKPVRTESGLFSSDPIVEALENLAGSQLGVAGPLYDIADQLKGWD